MKRLIALWVVLVLVLAGCGGSEVVEEPEEEESEESFVSDESEIDESEPEEPHEDIPDDFQRYEFHNISFEYNAKYPLVEESEDAVTITYLDNHALARMSVIDTSEFGELDTASLEFTLDAFLASFGDAQMLQKNPVSIGDRIKGQGATFVYPENDIWFNTMIIIFSDSNYCNYVFYAGDLEAGNQYIDEFSAMVDSIEWITPPPEESESQPSSEVVSEASSASVADPPPVATESSKSEESSQLETVPAEESSEPPPAVGQTAYWTPGGGSYHFSKDCVTLKRSRTINSGTVEEAVRLGKDDPCNICAGGT